MPKLKNTPNSNRENFGGEERGLNLGKLTINAFSVDGFEELLKASFSVEPAMMNGFLYRSYGQNAGDFEEDTYLDMHIFQSGKRLGKKLTGLENFEESEKLVLDAYLSLMKDKKRKKISYDYESSRENPKRIEEAYRKGDLDMLDSLEMAQIVSEGFQEKFLYKRNDIQAYSIDTLLKRTSVFAAVGAAHLPGKRGIIEQLRSMGYTVRPVQMDER
jgi:uncharacterized protein YbaP (TraB family)